MEKFIDCNLEFIEEGEENEAFASVTLNPNFQWAKIIVTDDKPNVNKQRVPLEEFDNLIKTGVHAPIKMQRGKISDGHQEGFGNPLGTITALRKVDDRVEALAALWKRERPEDIATLKDMYTKGTPPNVSWEIGYSDLEVDKEGIETLKDVSLNGLCIVGLPAYAGRTPFIAMASKETDKENKEIDTVELEELQTKYTALEADLNDKVKEIETLKQENQALAEYKNTIEKAKADAEKLENIKQKFEDAKLETSAEYFEKHQERFLNMSEEDLEFFIQELVSFASKKETAASDDGKRKEIPNLNGEHGDKLTPAEIAKALKEKKFNK